jgi:hypothetical protein
VNRSYWIAAILALVVVSVFFPHFVPWILGIYPVPAGTSPWYQFWSGFFIVGLSAATSSFLRKQNCHVKWCWRIGRFPVADSLFTVCRHHSPDPAVHHNRVTAEHIQKIYQDWNNQQG